MKESPSWRSSSSRLPSGVRAVAINFQGFTRASIGQLQLRDEGPPEDGAIDCYDQIVCIGEPDFPTDDADRMIPLAGRI